MYTSCRKVFHERDILILTVTRRCNLRCPVCPLERKNQSIEFSSAKKAISSFLSNSSSKEFLIRFFGGEPLLEFNLVKDIIHYAGHYAKTNGKKIVFNLTTNGILLDAKKIDFFGKTNDFELIINSYSLSKVRDEFIKSACGLAHVSVNVAIDPLTADCFLYDFFNLLKKGFRNFNFLPAYFTLWDRQKLKKVEQGLNIISSFLNKFGSTLNIQVKNIHNTSDIPLFNSSLTIDCDGCIYPSNLVLSKRLSRYKKELLLGNIRSLENSSEAFRRKSFDYKKILKQALEREILHSTGNVDRLLSGFVRDLSL